MGRITLCFIIVFLISCAAQNTVIEFDRYNIEKEYYPNGLLMYESSYRYNKLDGISKSWSEDGNLTSKVEYKNGLIHGTWETYYPSGKLKNRTLYIDGKKHGSQINW